MTGTATGSCKATFTDSYGQFTTVNVTVGSGQITVSPSVISTQVGETSTIAVTLPGTPPTTSPVMLAPSASCPGLQFSGSFSPNPLVFSGTNTGSVYWNAPISPTTPMTCTIRFTLSGAESAGLTAPPPVTVYVDSTPAATPSSVSVAVGATSQSITVTNDEPASFTEKDTCSSIATFSPAFTTTAATSLTFTVTGKAGGTCRAVFTDTFGQSGSLAIIVTAPPSASPATISTYVGGAAQTVTISETNYTGSFTVPGTCSSSSGSTVATITPAAASGTFTVTGKAVGTCTATFTDSNSQSAKVTIAVLGALTATPNAVSLNGLGTANQSSFQASETGFSGTFAVTGCSANATVTPSTASASGGAATITVVGTAAGTCSLSVSDGLGQSISVPVTVTVTTIGGS